MYIFPAKFQELNCISLFCNFYIYIFNNYSTDSHSIDTEDLKEGLLHEIEITEIDSNEYIKHFLLLIMQTVAMFVVSKYKF